MNILSLDSIPIEKIYTRLENTYVTNVDYTQFLENNQYEILLDRFICVLYGNTVENVRKIQFVQFLEAAFLSKSKLSYHIYIYETKQDLWVQDTLVLRKKMFQFTDHTSLLRTTFLYDPITDEIYRLQELRYSLKILAGELVLPPIDHESFVKEEKFVHSDHGHSNQTRQDKRLKSILQNKEEYEIGKYYSIIHEDKKKQIYKKMCIRLHHFSKSIENPDPWI